MRRLQIAIAFLLCLAGGFARADYPVSGTGGTGSVNSGLILDGTIVDADVNASAAIDMTKIGGGAVTNAELLHLDNVTSSIQTQINAKQATVTEGSLTDSVIVSGDIKDNTITGSDLASDIAIATTGYIAGKVVVLATGDNTTLTDTQGHGIIVFVSAERTITLPPVAAAGYSVCVQAVAAVTVDVDPDSSDGIRLNGSARDTNGDAIYSSGTAGDQICLVSDSASGWTTTGRSGTWAAR